MKMKEHKSLNSSLLPSSNTSHTSPVDAGGQEFGNTVLVLTEIWQNYLLLLYEIYVRIPQYKIPENVIFGVYDVEMGS
jgi:hypothetical protein